MAGTSELRAARLSGKSARRIVHERLRQQILELQLPPGAALSEAEIATAFGVSRTPVRESLLLLAEEGLVDIYPQRGSFVGPIHLSDVVTAQFIREALECTSLEQSAPSIGRRDIADLRELLAQQRAADISGDITGFFGLDEAFHRRLLDAGNHAAAWPIVSQAKAQMDRARRMSLPSGGKMADLIAQHTRVVDAIENGDPPAAVDALRTHLRVVLSDIERMNQEKPDLFSAD